MARVIIAIGVFLFSLSLPAYAAMQTFTKEYEYRASDADSKITSRAIALNEVTTLLLKEIGVYIQSQFGDKSSNKSPDEVIWEITTLTAGVVSANVIDEKWDGKTYWLKAEIKADPDEVAKKVEELRGDKQKSKELEDLRKRQDESNKEIARLRKELDSGKADKDKIAEYNTAVESLSVGDLLKKGAVFLVFGGDRDTVSPYNEPIEFDPKSAADYNNRGSFYHSRGNNFTFYTLARKDFDKAIELDPKFALAYNNRGTLYLKFGKHQEAMGDFRAAARLGHKGAQDYLRSKGESW